MKLNPSQMRRLVRLVMDGLESAGLTDTKDEHAVAEVIEHVIAQDLKLEEEVEREAQALIKRHTANVHADAVDYEVLFKRAKQELAKKKGFAL